MRFGFLVSTIIQIRAAVMREKVRRNKEEVSSEK